MLGFIEKWILQAGTLGFLGFFIGGVVEEMFLPIPTPLVFVGVALYIGKTLTTILVLKILGLIILPITLGATVGSLIMFSLGYVGGKVAIDRFSKWIRFSWDDVEQIRVKLAAGRSDEWLLFVTRVLPFCPTKVFNLAAGLVRMNPYTFTLIVFIAVSIRIALLFFGLLLFGGAFFTK